jgi:hypothetical protein
MQSMTIETTPDKVLITLDKKYFNQDAIIAMVKLIEIEAMAQKVNFSPEIAKLGEENKRQWWQENKEYLIEK